MTTEENPKQNDDSESESRRTFLKLGVAGAGLAAAAVGGVNMLFLGQ